MTDPDDSHDAPDTDVPRPESEQWVSFDPVDDSVAETLIRTVAAHDDRDPRELPPLADAVSIDVLDRLFQPRLDGTPRSSERSLFLTYAGYEVRIHSDGLLVLSRPPGQGTGAEC